MATSPTTPARFSEAARRRLGRIVLAASKDPVLKRLGPKARWDASLVLVSSAKMRALNFKYRRLDRPTDVLSFEAPAPVRDASGFLGELVICLPILRAQAKERSLTPEQELHVLIVHGLLHLLGLDHERGPRHRREMAALEQRLLDRSAPRAWVRGRVAGLIDRIG